MQKRKDKINRKKYHSILVIAAIAIVVLLDAGMILMPDHTSSDMENRTLQTFPKLTFSTLVSGKFESEFETYIADQFPFRNKWITLESTVSRMMGKTESNDIFLAKGGYLIQNFHTPSDEQYASLLEGYKGIAKLTEGTDITLNAMIVPTAVNIYSKKLPFGAVKGIKKLSLHSFKVTLLLPASTGLIFLSLLPPATKQLSFTTEPTITGQVMRPYSPTRPITKLWDLMTAPLIPKKYFPILSKVLCPLPAACVHQKRMKFMRIFRIRPQITLSA